MLVKQHNQGYPLLTLAAIACLLLLPAAAEAQYLETFSTQNKGYQINFIDHLTTVNWALTPWATAGGERDAADDFNSTAAGGMESIELDQEVCRTFTYTIIDSDMQADLATVKIRVQ